MIALCGGGLSAEGNPIGSQSRDPINSGLTRWRLAVYYVNAVAENGRDPVSKHQIQPERGE